MTGRHDILHPKRCETCSNKSCRFWTQRFRVGCRVDLVEDRFAIMMTAAGFTRENGCGSYKADSIAASIAAATVAGDEVK